MDKRSEHKFDPKPKSEWMLDSSSNNCSVCKNVITSTFFKSNKHHCRYCGNIVCEQCSQNKINTLRSCNQCYESFANRNSSENKCNDDINDHMEHYHRASKLFNEQLEYDKAYHEMLQSWQINDQLNITERVDLFGYICIKLDKEEELELFLSKMILKHRDNVKCNFWYAKTLSDMNKLNEAETVYRKLLSLQPDECFLGYPSLLLKQKKFDQALEHSMKHISLRKDDAHNHDVFFEHGLVLFEMANYDEAFVYFAKVIDRDAVRLGEYYYDKYYECLIKLERFDDALTFSAKMIERFEGKIKYRLQHASDLKRMKRYDEAIDEYIKSLELDPENVPAFCRLIWIFINQKQYEKAQKYSNKMLNVLPQHASSFSMNGHVTFAMKQYDRCKEFREKCIELDTASLSYKWNYLELLLAIPKLEEAKLMFDKVAKNNPESYKAHLYGNWIYSRLDMNSAVIHSEKMISLDANNGYGYHSLGCDYWQLNKVEKAKQLLQTAMTKKKQSCFFRFYGIVLRDEGDLKESQQYFIDAIALENNENTQESQRSRGHLCFVRNQLEESCKYFHQAIDTYYANPFVHYWLGISLTFLNEFKQAEISLKNSLQINPGFARCHHELGLLLIERLYKFDEGLNHLEQANAIFPNNEQFSLSLEKYIALNDETNIQDKGNIKLVLDTAGHEAKYDYSGNMIIDTTGQLLGKERKESEANCIQEPGMNHNQCNDLLLDIKEVKQPETEENKQETHINNGPFMPAASDICAEEFSRFLKSAIPNGVNKYLKKFIDNEMDDIRYVDCDILDIEVLENEIKMKKIDRKLFVKQMIKYQQNCKLFENKLNEIGMLNKYQMILQNNAILSFWSFHHNIQNQDCLNHIIQNKNDAKAIWNHLQNEQEIEGKQ